MADMSSFYGGRQGAAFVIVKRFDGINIPQPGDGSGVTNYTYTQDSYAVDANQQFIITTDDNVGNVEIAEGQYLIKQNHDNYKNYNWQMHSNNGDRVNETSYAFPEILAQGMVQCFARGVKSSSEVNYGEYIIIDTIANLHNKNDVDNGKVFRRGMNIDSELAGAEYIGQIVGPQGETPEIDFTTYTELNSVDEEGNDKYIHKNESYNPLNDGIIPGSYVQNGTRFYEDEIRYSWATVRDAFGNVQGCLIGFKIPTLIQEFEAQSMSPYEQREINADGKYYNYGLISEDESQFDKESQKWQHPFYQKWQIKVPHGYHGINSTNIEIIPTRTMPTHFKDASFPGTALYVDAACTEPYLDNNGIAVILAESWEIERDNKFDNSEDVISAIVHYDNQDLYVRKKDCYMDIMRYRETDFDNYESGEVTYFEIGDYNIIRRITISEDGTLTVFYSAESQPQELEQVLRWIDTKDSKGIEIDDDGTIHVYYNTLDENGEHEHQDYPTVLDWITNVTLTQEGNFTILYNNNTVQTGVDDAGKPVYSNRYNTTLNWVDKVTFLDDGTINFYYNSDHDEPAFHFEKVIKYLTNVQIETTDNSQLEGTGDQRVHLTYNVTDSAGENIVDIIGNPLNYIIESCISIPTTSFPTAPYSHLLVYYSDPELRQKYKDKWVQYPSTKIIDRYENDENGEPTIPIYHIWNEWVDLGQTRGQAGGLHILTDVANMNELKGADGAYMPPETLVINGEIATYAAGWAVTLTDRPGAASQILFYDYEDKIWYSIGSIDAAFVEPKYIIAKSRPDANQKPYTGDVDDLKANGIWLASETAYYAF